VNVENLTRNHGFCPILIQSFPGEFPLNQSKEIHIPGWWFQPEKYEFVSWDYYSILFPIYGKKMLQTTNQIPILPKITSKSQDLCESENFSLPWGP